MKCPHCHADEFQVLEDHVYRCLACGEILRTEPDAPEVNVYLDGKPLPGGRVKNPSDEKVRPANPQPEPVGQTPPPRALDKYNLSAAEQEEILQFCRENKLLQAVAALVRFRKIGIAEGKEAVEQFCRENGLSDKLDEQSQNKALGWGCWLVIMIVMIIFIIKMLAE